MFHAQAPHPSPHAPRHGFTLVEAALVTAALAILVVLAAPSFVRTAHAMRAEQAALELTQLLRYAHERAVTHSETVHWVWDDADRRAHLEVLSESGGLVSLEGRVGQSDVLREDMTVELTRAGLSVERVRFFPDGRSEAATLQLTHRERMFTVTVDAMTSQVLLTTGGTT